MAEHVIVVAAVGRHLELGMLYNCHDDSYIPGVYLWDTSNIGKNKVVTPSPQTSFQTTWSDSLEDKRKILGVSASLSVSLFSGLINVEVSASYLNDRSSSATESRVTTKYGVTTTCEHLNWSQMGATTYEKIRDPDLKATHFVVQVEYGAEALLVFSESTTEENTKQDIQAKMKFMLDKFSSFNISAEGQVQMTDEEKKKVENTSCTFHGDFDLPTNPSNFEEAVKVYRDLPNLLGPNKENVVPKKVWLVPLSELVPSAPELISEVSEITCFKLQSVMEQLASAEMKANDILKDSESLKISPITKRMGTFLEHIQEYQLVFKDNLSSLLPEIRKGAQEEEKLKTMLELHNDSPFAERKVSEWLKDRETEVNIINSYITEIESLKLPNFQVLAPEDLHQVVSVPSNNEVYAFTFTSVLEEDPYLSSLAQHLGSDTSTSQPGDPKDQPLPWYKSPEVSQSMRDTFLCLSKITKQNEKQNEVYIATYDHLFYDDPGASFRYYNNSLLWYVDCANPLKPVIVDVGANSITMRHWKPINDLLIVYKKVSNEHDEHMQSVEWPAEEKTLLISDLHPNTEYQFWAVRNDIKFELKLYTIVTKPN